MHVLPEMFIVRPAAMDDFDEVVNLLTTSLLKESGTSLPSSESLRQIWTKIDLEHDSWLIVTGTGEMIGHGLLLSQVPGQMKTGVYIHYDYADQGIEAFLMRLIEDRVMHRLRQQDQEQTLLRCTVSGWNQAAQTYLLSDGFQKVEQPEVEEEDFLSQGSLFEKSLAGQKPA